jgi:hypothetical protein
MARVLCLSRVGNVSDYHSATAQKPTLIVPHKDADGLFSGVIIHRTLVKLGLNPKFLDVHLVQKGSNVHEENERKLMLEKNPKFIFVLDQGSVGLVFCILKRSRPLSIDTSGNARGFSVC